MANSSEVAFLREEEGTATMIHPILHLTDEELRAAIGGVTAEMASTASGSYDRTEMPKMCCDGTKICCN